ncbi:hypothetical protein ACWEN3_14860 [Streptomyces sp. NPDC004561]
MENSRPPYERLSYGACDVDELIDKLLDVGDNWPFVAASHLICEHREWLHKPDFYRFLITGEKAGRRWVGIYWPDIHSELKAGTVEGSHEDLFILKVGASITLDHPIRLATDPGNLSDRALLAVMRAIAFMQGMEEDVVDDCCPLDE